METYFIFSDESGEYKREKSEEFLKKNPFYIRAAFIINSSDWKSLNSDLNNIKKNHNIPSEIDLKWSDLWLLKRNKVPKNREFLKNFNYQQVFSYIENSLKTFSNIPYKKIVFTVTDNRTVGKVNEPKMLEMHIQNIIQRFQRDLEEDTENLALVFVDSLDQQKEKKLKDATYKLLTSGDFFVKYTCIKNSINFEYSHHCVGIQLADLIAGIFISHLKSFEFKGYKISTNFFNKYIFQNIRERNGLTIGNGVIDVPRRNDLREKLKQYFFDEVPF